MTHYSISPSQLEKLKNQLHGKNAPPNNTSTHTIKSYSLTRELQKVLLFSSLILISQIILLKIF